MALKSFCALPHITLFHKHWSQFTYTSSSSSPTLVSILFPKSTTTTSPTSTCIHEPHNEMQSSVSPSFSKRELSLTFILTTFLWGVLPDSILLAEEQKLQRYTDSKEGFTLLKPSSWTKVDKAGATVLFQDANMGSNNIGVVVNPVRLANLGEFGTPEFVADKLLKAERRKESTNDTELITVAERSGEGGVQIYEFEYKLDSSRGGMKRIFSAVFVASKKLYFLNIVHSDKPESPLDPHKRMMLEQVLHSFDAAS